MKKILQKTFKIFFAILLKRYLLSFFLFLNFTFSLFLGTLNSVYIVY